MHKYLCVQNDTVAFHENRIAVGDEGFSFTLDHNDDGETGNIQISDTIAVPVIGFRDLHFDEVYVVFLAVFADALDAAVLVNETCGNNTCRNRDHADTQEGNENT